MEKLLNRILKPSTLIVMILILCPSGVQAQQAFYSVSSTDDQLRIVDATTGATVSSISITLAGSTVGWANGLALQTVGGEL